MGNRLHAKFDTDADAAADLHDHVERRKCADRERTDGISFRYCLLSPHGRG